jgi:hypothetical protein
VLVGEVGGGAHRETLALGNTTNVAARVQSLAQPGEVLVSEQVRRLVADAFVLESAGLHPVKGLSLPLAVHRVRREAGAKATARRERGPFVGRSAELSTLLERWRTARQGRGQVLLVTGEPGIGKSRLVAELRQRLEAEGVRWLQEAASPDAQHSPFSLVRSVFTRALGLDAGTPPEASLKGIEAALAQVGLEPETNAPLLAGLLDLPTGDRYPPLLIAPEQARKRLLRLLVDWIARIAERAPGVFVIEDLHWADPSTLESITLLVERVAGMPLLLLLTARSEFRVPWPLRGHHGVLTLTRLPPAEVRAMIDALVDVRAIPEDLAERLAERSDGVPLFAEELARSLGERLDEATALHQIPATLQDTLSARLLRLGTARDLTQIASVLGREFSRSLLHAVSGLDDAALEAALEANVGAELLVESHAGSEVHYAFRHALIQQAAYDSLLKRRRRELHADVARVLAERFPALCAARPELLAQHWTAAGQPDQAAEAWQQAGRRAVDQFAHSEATSHFEAALDALARLPEGRERDRREFDLQLHLRSAVSYARGFAAPETARNADRVQLLSERLGDSPSNALVALAQWSVRLSRGEIEAALAVATQSRKAAERAGDGPTTVVGWIIEAGALMNLGRFEAGRAAAARARELMPCLTSHPLFDSMRAQGHLYGGIACAQLGYASETEGLCDEVLASVDEQARPAHAPHALCSALVPLVWLRQLPRVVSVADRLREAARRAEMPIYVGMADIYGSWAQALLDPARDSVPALREGIEVQVRLGQRLGLGQHLCWLAEAQLARGRAAEALATLEDGLQFRSEQLWPQTELHRLRARALEAAGAGDGPAEAALREAVQAGADRCSPLLRLRASLDLARLLARRGREAEAAAALASALPDLPGDGDCPERDDARALLASLPPSRPETRP